MRRKDREITDLAAIEEILRAARIVHLGLVDGTMPYVVPLHYGYTLADGKLTLYMHGAREGHKLDLIRANPNAFVEIDTDEELISGGDNACSYGASYASVMGSGHAMLVEDPEEKVRGLNVLMRTQTGRSFPITAQMAAGVAVIRVDVDSFSAKRKPKPQ
ncbi:MAG: pyridoxamine 5'-phosphate oxidase family protein [Oscillospiraceae bacterium]|nr:pyridoxamine 5'-phosphate oxidase family protein [Oscillospiraceae bacterium]